MKIRQTILVLSLFFAIPLLAQENDELGIWSEIGIEKSITKSWDVGLDLEYRAQNKARFSTSLGTSYKVNKYLKFGLSYSFLYSEKNAYKDKSEGEIGSGDWTKGYKLITDDWYPRHRFSAEATGSIKLWSWFKISLRERYQLTRRRERNVNRLVHLENHVTEIIDWDEDFNPITEDHVYITDKTEIKNYPALTDQVLRSRLKLEYDKKRCPYSPFVSAEFHNSVSKGENMLLQKIRTSAGCSYKFRKHNEVSLSYTTTFYMYDIEEDATVRLHERRHAICLGYKYSF